MITIKSDKFTQSVCSPVLRRRKPIIFACPKCLKVETFYILHSKTCSSCGAVLPNIEDCAFTLLGRFDYHKNNKVVEK